MLNSYIVGFYLPAMLAVLAFFRLLTSKSRYHRHPQYPIVYLLSLLFIVQMPFWGIGGWLFIDPHYKEIRLLNIYPLIIMFCYWWHVRHQHHPTKLSVPWVCLGSFSTALIADTYMAYMLIDDFTFAGIGGAGWYDGLLYITVVPTLIAHLINRAIHRGFRLKLPF